MRLKKSRAVKDDRELHVVGVQGGGRGLLSDWSVWSRLPRAS